MGHAAAQCISVIVMMHMGDVYTVSENWVSCFKREK